MKYPGHANRAHDDGAETSEGYQRHQRADYEGWLRDVDNYRLRGEKRGAAAKIRTTAIAVLQLDCVFRAAGWTKHCASILNRNWGIEKTATSEYAGKHVSVRVYFTNND